MILRVLLCPFLELPAQSEDLLCLKAKAYSKMVNSRTDESFCRRAYENASKKMERWLEEKILPDRLSEMDALLEMFYPEEELRRHLNRPGVDNLDGYYINVLLQLASEFVTLRDGRASIRMWDEQGKDRYFYGSGGLYKVELWSVLSRLITPDALIAAYFVTNGINDIRQLAGLSDNLTLSDKLLAGVVAGGVAETHLHLNAGMSYLAVWQVVTDPTSQRIFKVGKEPMLQEMQKDELEYYSLLVSGWLRLLMACYLEDKSGSKKDIYDFFMSNGQENNMENHILGHILSSPGSAESRAELYKYIICHRSQNISRLCRTYIDHDEELDVLLRGPYRPYRYLKTEPELILLYHALQHIVEHPEHRQFSRIFLNYLRIKNRYFGDKFQTSDGGGLAFFSRYFSKASSAMWASGHEDKKKSQMIYESAFRNQLHCSNLQKLEVKISPQISDVRNKTRILGIEYVSRDKKIIARQLKQIFEAYLQVCREQPEGASMPNLGIVYHFKKTDVHSPNDNGCWVPADNSYPTDGISILRAQCTRFLRALRALLEETPFLSEYVVGIDAASQELKAEPWIYAPVYRFARSRESTLPLNSSTRMPMQSLGLTYHVGEDYHHILTGLRHIDEVITYFGYKPGDRLGHATALHVDLEAWVHDNETVPVRSLDRLEDLLWLWNLCEECPEDLGRYRFELESMVMKLASQLLGNTKGLSPYAMWEAYKSKFKALEPDYCKSMQESYLVDFTPCMKYNSNSFMMDSQRPFCLWSRMEEHIWDAGKLLMTNYCPIYMRHYKKPILVFTPRDALPMLRAVQMHIKEKVQDLGIFVETNPTSNISICDVGSLRDYRITSLNAPAVSENDPMNILLSINSDDPLVFNTNVENELALIYHTLTYNGYGREVVLKWTDKVRQYGMDSSFIRTVKSREQIIDELETIVDSFRKIEKDYSQ